jgi:diguanylate cyclase (GGDEF)-like protein/PAS domain S-box-containing protein
LYKAQFQEILDIRDGRAPRPQEYGDVYWDLVLNNDVRPRPNGPAGALMTSMFEAGFTADEFAKLSEAKKNSDDLTHIEFAAMKLVESDLAHTTGATQRAIQMLYDDAYHQAKYAIMRPIGEFSILANRRTTAEVHEAEQHALDVRYALIAVVLLQLALLWLTRSQLYVILGSSVDSLHRHIVHLAKGDFSTAVNVPKGREGSVLAWLSEIQAELAHLESLRQQEERALQDSEIRYRTAFMTSPDAINISSLADGRYLEVSDGFERMTGWSREEAVGKTVAQLGLYANLADRQRLADVLRRDGYFENVEANIWSRDGRQVVGLISAHLWSGTLSFSNVSVNYALDGRRMDVQIHVRILEGHEGQWDRVMVALEDVTDKVKAQAALVESERYARNLFDYSPVSLWVEDFSGVKALLDEAREQGIQDFRVFVSVHPDFVSRCAEKIRVLDVNQQTLQMFAARSKEDLLGNLDVVFRDEMHASFTEQLVDLWNGNTNQMREVVNYALSGSLLNIHMQFSVLTGHEKDWDLVLVSLVDITARKKAEAYLEYLGKHDSLTKLHNRTFYTEELNRISRRGPWPISMLAMDLNGLKMVNDQEGHAAGDSLLRRVGEVLMGAAADTKYCVARVGGDEFVAVLPGCDERVAQSFKERVESMLEINNQYYSGHKLSMAIGIATAESATHVDTLSHNADKAMFVAKNRYYEDNKLERRKSSTAK